MDLHLHGITATLAQKALSLHGISAIQVPRGSHLHGTAPTLVLQVLGTVSTQPAAPRVSPKKIETGYNLIG